MARTPFVWEIQVRREVLDDEAARLRELPFSVWCELVSAPFSRVVRGRDERDYRVQVVAAYEGDDIRVRLSLAQARGLRRRLLEQTFVITPHNTFRV